MLAFSDRFYFLSLLFLFVFSSSVLVSFIMNVDPRSASESEFVAFYLTMFFAALSGFALSSYALRVSLARNSPIYVLARISLRQGTLFALFLVTLFFLQSLRTLTLLSAALLALSLILLEAAFLSK